MRPALIAIKSLGREAEQLGRHEVLGDGLTLRVAAETQRRYLCPPDLAPHTRQQQVSLSARGQRLFETRIWHERTRREGLG